MKVAKILRLTGQTPEAFLTELKHQVDIVLSAQDKPDPCSWKSIAEFSGVDFEEIVAEPCGTEFQEKLSLILEENASWLLSEERAIKFDGLVERIEELRASCLEVISQFGPDSWKDVARVLDGAGALESPVWFAFLALLAGKFQNELVFCFNSPAALMAHPKEVPPSLWLSHMASLAPAFGRTEHKTLLRLLSWPWGLCAYALLAQKSEITAEEVEQLCPFLLLDEKEEVRPMSIFASIVSEMGKQIAGTSSGELASSVNLFPEYLLSLPWPGVLLRIWNRLLVTRTALDSSLNIETVMETEEQSDAVLKWTEAVLAWSGAI